MYVYSAKYASTCIEHIYLSFIQYQLIYIPADIWRVSQPWKQNQETRIGSYWHSFGWVFSLFLAQVYIIFILLGLKEELTNPSFILGTAGGEAKEENQKPWGNVWSTSVHTFVCYMC